MRNALWAILSSGIYFVLTGFNAVPMLLLLSILATALALIGFRGELLAYEAVIEYDQKISNPLSKD